MIPSPHPHTPTFIHTHINRIIYTQYTHGNKHTKTNTYRHTHTNTTHQICLFVSSLDLNSLNTSCLLLHQTPVTSHWIQTRHSDTSICLRGTGGWRGEMSSSHILIIQRDLMSGVRCCVERVCLDAATGRLSGVGRGLI